MSNSNATLVTPQIVEAGVVPAVATAAPLTSEPCVVAAGVEPYAESLPTGLTAQITSSPEPGAVATLEAGVEPSPGSLTAGQTTQMAGIPSPKASANAGVVPAANCGCNNGKKSNIYALGLIGFDFGTEARRDSFTQQMRGAIGADGRPLFADDTGGNPAANPYNPIQLSKYLDRYPSESTKLVWTLNLDLSPIYAIEAELGYPDEIYGVFRDTLRGESVDPTADDYVSRVSVPGYLTSRTVRLFSGQVVPVVVAQHRGMFQWNTNAVSKAAIAAIKGTDLGKALAPGDETTLQKFINNFLDKLYYQLRNLGQSSPDRALNYSATNVFQAADVFTQALFPGAAGLVPAPAADQKGFYAFNNVSVSKSPFCRFDSDCWDVQLSFFDPVNVLQANLVFQYTVDVSDEMPVTLGTIHSWTQGQSVLT